MFALTSRSLDIFAISLSAACLLHCLLLPLVLTLMPLAGAQWAGSESLHTALLLLALPSSVTALFIGCRRHGRNGIFWLGGGGLSLLITAWWLEAYLGVAGGRGTTAVGGSLLALAHIRNYLLCRKHECTHTACD